MDSDVGDANSTNTLNLVLLSEMYLKRKPDLSAPVWMIPRLLM